MRQGKRWTVVQYQKGKEIRIFSEELVTQTNKIKKIKKERKKENEHPNKIRETYDVKKQRGLRFIFINNKNQLAQKNLQVFVLLRN